MRNIFFTLIALFLSTCCHATLINFRENEHLNLILSRHQINRLVVEHDKITHVHFPEGMAQVSNDEAGSIYLHVLRDTPFTLFLTTEQGHHVSATLKTDGRFGQTVVLHALTQNKNTNLLPKQNIIALIEAMMFERKLESYSVETTSETPILLPNNALQLSSIKRYRGPQFAGTIYRLDNRSQKNQLIEEATLFDDAVHAVALTSNHIEPQQSIWVYAVRNTHG